MNIEFLAGHATTSVLQAELRTSIGLGMNENQYQLLRKSQRQSLIRHRRNPG